MGEAFSVWCSHRGYRGGSLFGLGGDVGRSGQLAVTAVCTRNGRLVDTNAGSAFEPAHPDRRKNGRSLPGQRPERNCRSWCLGP
jgi:hypothetical protein